MDLESQTNDATCSMVEILNSINLENKDTKDTDIINYNDNENKQIELTNVNQNINQQVELLSNDIDRKIGLYMLNELEKKQKYIEELEDAIKFQEKEISDLKQKLEVNNKLELLSKIKTKLDSKSTEIEMDMSSTIKQQNKEQNKVVQVKKTIEPIKVVKQDDQYPRNNPDLVLRRDTEPKVKSISKEEEEPRYNGIMILDKPNKQEEIKIVLDHETETYDSDKMTEVIKQRRRKTMSRF